MYELVLLDNDEEVENELEQEILGENVDGPTLLSCLQDYAEKAGVENNPKFCACCGEKAFDIHVEPIELDRLQLLEKSSKPCLMIFISRGGSSFLFEVSFLVAEVELFFHFFKNFSL